MKKIVSYALIGFFIVSIIAAAFAANYFCSSLSLNSISSSNGVLTAKEDCYFVYLNKSQNQLEAETIASDYLDGTCAGYVLKNDEYYYVIHSAYEKQNDAFLVSEHLRKSNIESEILVINLPKIIIEEEFSQEDHILLQEVLNSFFSSFRYLSDLAVGISTKVYQQNDASEKLEKITSKLITLQKNFDVAFETGSPKLLSIGQYLADEVECVMTTKVTESNLNFHAIELIEIYKNMCDEFN